MGIYFGEGSTLCPFLHDACQGDACALYAYPDGPCRLADAESVADFYAEQLDGTLGLIAGAVLAIADKLGADTSHLESPGDAPMARMGADAPGVAVSVGVRVGRGAIPACEFMAWWASGE